MTDREIMLNAEKRLNDIIYQIAHPAQCKDASVLDELIQIRNDVHKVTNSIIDYQVVVDNLDENILIADCDEKILYVNNAYVKNTGIPRDALIGRRVSDIVSEGKYFSASTVPDVLKRKERVMKLSHMAGGSNPGVVIGTPIFYEDGSIQYVVATNRGLSSFSDLRENFIDFINMLSDIRHETDAIQILDKDSSQLSEKTMIGNGKEMKKIKHFINNVAQTDATVLITGESGTGKELIADEIYKHSSRTGQPFVKINCSSIPGQLLESELFGYEKGAFSGASSKGKTGLFEAANNGTLLLDEIGDMPIDLQAKLLRAIQSNEITRVGGTKPIRLNIRLIASTNCNLKKKIAEGTFRSDLYYRLHVIPINVPPLRERREDIPLLCQHYINIFSQKYQRRLHLSEENIDVLCNYSWPGNIRELRNIMEYLVVCCSDMPEIENSFLYSIFDLDSPSAYIEINQDMTLNEAISKYEKEFLQATIKDVRTLKEASEILDVDISTVSRKLKQYGLNIKK